MDSFARGQSRTLDGIDEPNPEVLQAWDENSQPQRHALVVLVGDSVGDVDDTARLVTELLLEVDLTVDAVLQVAPKMKAIRKALETAVVGGADLVLTIGGTGVGPSNKTPDATRVVLDQILPGVSQALRASGLACGAIDAGTSRGIAGVSGSTMIVNLAPSRSAIRDGMATLGPLVHHVLDQLDQWTCD